MKGFTALIGLDCNPHEIFAIVFYCQRFSKFKREHSGFFDWVGEAFFFQSFKTSIFQQFHDQILDNQICIKIHKLISNK